MIRVGLGAACLLMLPGCAQAQPGPERAATECRAAASAFWSGFRDAVRQNDYAALSAQSRFPLEIAGALDGASPRAIAAGEFAATMAAVLDGDSGLRAEPWPVRDVVMTSTQPDNVRCTDAQGSFDVSQLHFEFGAGRWRLTRMYQEE